MSDVFRQYEYLGNSIFEYNFESLNAFLNYIKTGTINRNVFSDKLSSETGGYDFTKTSSLAEAMKLCQNGCDEKFDGFLKLKNEVSKNLIKTSEISVLYKDVTGFIPSVPDYIIGSPLNMWNKTNKNFNNIIDIYFQVSCSSYTTTSQIFNRGAITLSIIDALEKSGYAVNLHTFEFSYNPYEYDVLEFFLSFFKLKDCTQFLNEKIAYFPLCHPSFLRRCLFRLTEITPFKSWRWSDGYGRVIDSIDTINKYIKPKENSIIILTPQVLGIKGNNIQEDLSIVLKSLELEKFLKRA